MYSSSFYSAGAWSCFQCTPVVENRVSAARAKQLEVSQGTENAYKLAKKYKVYLIVVAHPSKMLRGQGGKYPVPGLYDISDSAHWSNKADKGIVVHREDLIASKETIIRVVKSR